MTLQWHWEGDTAAFLGTEHCTGLLASLLPVHSSKKHVAEFKSSACCDLLAVSNAGVSPAHGVVLSQDSSQGPRCHSWDGSKGRFCSLSFLTSVPQRQVFGALHVEISAQQVDTAVICTPYIFLPGFFWRSSKTEFFLETPLISILSCVLDCCSPLEGIKSIVIRQI